MSAGTGVNCSVNGPGVNVSVPAAIVVGAGEDVEAMIEAVAVAVAGILGAKDGGRDVGVCAAWKVGNEAQPAINRENNTRRWVIRARIRILLLYPNRTTGRTRANLPCLT